MKKLNGRITRNPSNTKQCRMTPANLTSSNFTLDTSPLHNPGNNTRRESITTCTWTHKSSAISKSDSRTKQSDIHLTKSAPTHAKVTKSPKFSSCDVTMAEEDILRVAKRDAFRDLMLTNPLLGDHRDCYGRRYGTSQRHQWDAIVLLKLLESKEPCERNIRTRLRGSSCQGGRETQL